MKVFVRLVLVLINSLLLLSLVAWPFVLFSAGFVFEGAEWNPVTIGLVLTIIGYPVPIIAGCFGFRRHRHRDSTNRVLLRYTLLGLASPALLLCFGFAVQLFCDGQFACSQ